MNRWETPSFEEIAMNAEIGAYQDDLERPVDREPDFAEGDEREE